MPLASQLSSRLATAVRLTGALAIAGALLYFAFQVQRPQGGVWDGVGMVAWTAGDLVWQLAYSQLEIAPYPSISDALYLLFYPCAYATLVLLLRRRAQGLGAGVWLDGIAGACAAAAVGSALLLPVLQGDADADHAVRAHPYGSWRRAPRTPRRCAACRSSAASWCRASS